MYISLVVFPPRCAHDLSVPPTICLSHSFTLSISISLYNIYSFTTRSAITRNTYAAANVNRVNVSDVDVVGTLRRLDVLSIADGLSGAHPKRFTVICIIYLSCHRRCGYGRSLCRSEVLKVLYYIGRYSGIV